MFIIANLDLLFNIVILKSGFVYSFLGCFFKDGYGAHLFERKAIDQSYYVISSQLYVSTSLPLSEIYQRIF